MDNASDKKPLLPSNSSRASGEGSSKESKFESKTDTKTESNKETNKDSKKESIKDSKKSKKETPPVDGAGNGAPTRVIRPTVQARPFSTKTKGIYWIFTILHLVILLSVLFAISYGLLLFVFAQTSEGPLYWGKGSFIGGVPAVMYEPIDRDKEAKKGKISFDHKDNKTYNKYVKRLKEVMNYTEILNVTEIDEGKKQCLAHKINLNQNGMSNGRYIGNRTDTQCYLEHSLSLNYTDFCGDTNMGYSTGRPCLLIRLTKILGFFPSLGNFKDDNEEDKNWVKKEKLYSIENATCGGTIYFNCTAYRKDNETDTIPLKSRPDGIPFCHFPFWRQKDYKAPYIMIRPNETLKEGETVIKCVPNLKKLKHLSNGAVNEVTIIVDMAQNGTAITNGNTTTSENPVNDGDKSTTTSEEKVTTPIPTTPLVVTDNKNKDDGTTTEIPTTSTVKTE